MDVIILMIKWLVSVDKFNQKRLYFLNKNKKGGETF